MVSVHRRLRAGARSRSCGCGPRRCRRVGAGVALVAVAAALWGSDAVFRRPLVDALTPAEIVFAEHALLVLATLPWLPRALRAARNFGAREWAAVALVGVGASAVATTLFTAAFAFGDPTTPLLLQKLQPLLAVLGARVLLGERLEARYWGFFAAGVAGAYLVAFPDPVSVTITAAAPAAFAVGAAALWGLGTVLGRLLTAFVDARGLTALRVLAGLPATVVVVVLQGDSLTRWVSAATFAPLVLLAAVPGLFALVLYYRGLHATPAAVATLAELAFPLSAILLGYLVFDATLTPTQMLGTALLAGTVTVMGLLGARRPVALGVRTADGVVPAA